MRKRFLSKTILLFFVFFIFNIKCYASNSDFTYVLDNNSATITSYKGSSDTITIPSTIDGYQVKKIANHAFDPNWNNGGNSIILKKVTISEGITTIGDFAFAGNTNLESIKLPETLTSLGDQTFVGCKKLNKINIPSRITNLGSSGYMFQETGFTEFTIPENVKSIPNGTFRICTNLKKVVVYSNDVRYGANAFEHSSSNLILYGNEGSTTQAYAQQNGLQFRIISNESENIPVTSITLNKSSLSLDVGNTETLSATVLPNNATNKSLTWSSSNSNVATVSNGKVTAKKAGSAVITVSTTDGTKKATCNITVTKKEGPINPTIIPVTSITLNKSSLSLDVGNTETLSATVLPNNATNKSLTWSSSDSNVATVTNGKITAKSVGSAVITVSTADGTKKAICNITVTKTEGPVDPTIIPVTSITLNKSSLSLDVGNTETLSATILPNDAINENLIWSSSDSNVVTVTNGKITAKSAGSAVITVSTADGTKKDICNITVTNKASISDSSQDDATDNTTDDDNSSKNNYIYIILAVLFSLSVITLILIKRYKFLKLQKLNREY